MSEPCCAAPRLLPTLPSDDRHGRALDVAARTGTLVTLLAVIVLGAAVGGSLSGAATAERPTVTVTYDR